MQSLAELTLYLPPVLSDIVIQYTDFAGYALPTPLPINDTITHLLILPPLKDERYRVACWSERNIIYIYDHTTVITLQGCVDDPTDWAYVRDIHTEYIVTVTGYQCLTYWNLTTHQPLYCYDDFSGNLIGQDYGMCVVQWGWSGLAVYDADLTYHVIRKHSQAMERYTATQIYYQDDQIGVIYDTNQRVEVYRIDLGLSLHLEACTPHGLYYISYEGVWRWTSKNGLEIIGEHASAVHAADDCVIMQGETTTVRNMTTGSIKTDSTLRWCIELFNIGGGWTVIHPGQTLMCWNAHDFCRLRFTTSNNDIIKAYKIAITPCMEVVVTDMTHVYIVI